MGRTKDGTSKKMLMRKRTSLGEKAITLIALVVTIVILLILAGVTITMTLGQNGLFTRARAGAAAYNESEVRDDLSMLITQYTWDKAAEKTDKSLGDYLKENGATSVKANTDGTTLEVEYKGYVFTVNKDSGEITSVSKAGPRPQVSGVKVTEDSAGQGNNVEQGKIAADSGKKLYITFTSSIEGGTTTVSPAVPYEVSKNGSYKFTITGTVGGKTYSLEYTVTINQYKIDTSKLIGKIVSYTPDTPSTGYDLSTAKSGSRNAQTIDGTYDPTTWKIMEVDENGNITKLFGSPISGQSMVGLSSSIGYNNGVYLLNDICKSRYGNASLGATARSLNIEDIESRMNLTGIAARNAYKSGTIQYGTTKTFTGSNAEYPTLYEQEKYAGVYRDAQGNVVEVSDVADGTQIITESADVTAQSKMNPSGKTQSKDIYTSPAEGTWMESWKSVATSLTCTQTVYYFYSTPSSYFDDSNFYDMIFGTGTYFWIASRGVDCTSGYSNKEFPWFGLRYVYKYNLEWYRLFSADGSYGREGRLAPVVTFDSAIQIKSGSGTTENPYIIGK